MPVSALSHATLVSATMSIRNIGASPRVLTLRFSEPVNTDASTVRINMGGGSAVPLRIAFSQDRRTMYATPDRRLGLGTYQLVWRSAARDGHVLRGAYDFVILY